MIPGFWPRSPHSRSDLHPRVREAAQQSPLATDEMAGATVVLRKRDLELLAHDQRLVGIGLALFDLMGITEGRLRDCTAG